MCDVHVAVESGLGPYARASAPSADSSAPSGLRSIPSAGARRHQRVVWPQNDVRRLHMWSARVQPRPISASRSRQTTRARLLRASAVWLRPSADSARPSARISRHPQPRGRARTPSALIRSRFWPSAETSPPSAADPRHPQTFPAIRSRTAAPTQFLRPSSRVCRDPQTPFGDPQTIPALCSRTWRWTISNSQQPTSHSQRTQSQGPPVSIAASMCGAVRNAHRPDRKQPRGRRDRHRCPGGAHPEIRSAGGTIRPLPGCP